MLIASMGETFQRVRESKASEMMYQKAKMIAMIELNMPLKERIEKKFWVEVKPPGCTEKKHFMVVHDDGVAATANSESATFPDSCQVTLNLPDAELLHKKQGTIVGARDPVCKQYQVQLQDKQTIESWGSTIVKVSEAQMKWHEPESKPESQSEKEKEYVGTSKNSKLPSRPFIHKTSANQNCNSTKAQVSFVSPSTLATEGFRKDTPANGLIRSKVTPAPASPPPQRSLLSSPPSRSPGQSRRGPSSQERIGSSPPRLARQNTLDASSTPIVLQDLLNTNSETLADSSSNLVASHQPTPPSKRSKRKLAVVEQRESARARVTPVDVSKTPVSKRARDDNSSMPLRSQRRLRNKQ